MVIECFLFSLQSGREAVSCWLFRYSRGQTGSCKDEVART